METYANLIGFSLILFERKCKLQEFKHIPVMLSEVIDALDIKEDGIYVDGTIGGAGHSIEIIKRLSNKGLLIGIDRDEEALKASRDRLKEYKNFKLVHDNHDNIKQVLDDLDIDKVDGILLDLGVSSYQLDEKKRGFSYISDDTLDMRMDKSQKFSALDVVNNYSQEELANIIYEYGEEKYARRIAKNICENRPITKTSELAKIIEKSKPYEKGAGHPAKKTFQAIRIEVNNEIKPLYDTVLNCIDCLKNNGRLAIITFHSLEDRAVKEAFTDAQGKCTCPKDIPVCVCNYKSLGKIINKKPIEASDKEKEENSRSKSAKLRVFKREEKR